MPPYLDGRRNSPIGTILVAAPKGDAGIRCTCILAPLLVQKKVSLILFRNNGEKPVVVPRWDLPWMKHGMPPFIHYHILSYFLLSIGYVNKKNIPLL